MMSIKMRYFTPLIILLLLSISMSAKPTLSYHIAIEQPQTHYIEVEMRIDNWNQNELNAKLPVWTPGSYLVREFARKIDSFNAYTADGKALESEKIRKNVWRVQTKKATNIVLKYRVYAFEFSVRTSFVDADHATLNAASVLMFVDGLQDQASTLQIKPHSNWKTISTSLNPLNANDPFTLHIPNYDILVDSPIEIGNHETHSFEAGGVPHQLALIGNGNYDTQTMIADIKKIVDEEVKIFGEHPCERYVIFNYSTENLYGGLEHLNSCALTFPRWEYATKYGRWQGLMSHEYFHLWNVKRVRPKELGPFDYENENYTHLLWLSEGTTSYYDDLVLRRNGLLSENDYLNIVANNINELENKPGDKVQSVAESSWDAWIKYYRADEHFDNISMSYYMKGAVISHLLDLEILHNTKGKKDFDDVLRYLYEEYYKKQGRGITDAEMQAAVEKIAGKSLDEFFKKYIFGTERPDYKQYLGYVGLTLTDANADNKKVALGMNTKLDNGKVIVAKTLSNGVAYQYGLNVNDEIIAIDNYRVSSEALMETLLNRKKIGEEVTFLINRAGILKTITLTLARDPKVAFKLEKVAKPSALQAKLYQKWLKTDQ
jgi:predicted metalloprotease with PDZ domain